MKIYLIFLVLSAFMAASSAYSVYFDLKSSEKAEPQGSDTDGGEVAARQPFSMHIPPYLSPLNLKSGELKAFAGHSFQFIKAKCPAIPREKIDNLGKYVAKLISKTDPTPERSPIVTELVTSLAQCAMKVPDSKIPSWKDSDIFWKNVYFGLFESDPTRTDDAGEATPRSAEIDSDASSLPPQTGDYIPAYNVYWTDSDSTSSTPWNPIKWLGKMFNSLKELAEKLFGIDSAASREKRDVLDQPTEEAQGNDDKSLLEMVNQLISNPVDEKNAFLNFFDNLCRIYCATCPHSFPTGNFKAAAKELMEFILKDESGSKLAAQYYLDNTVQQALNNC